MKKVLIFLGIIVVVFTSIALLNNYQSKEKLNNNPYGTNKLKKETIAQLDDEDYQNIILPNDLQQLLEEGKSQAVYFFSPTCYYCNLTTPIVVDLAKDLNIDLKLYNVYEFEQGWDEYQLEGTPTLIYFKDGKEFARKVGYDEKDVFEKWMHDNITE
ncbi:thioredoxin family protein [Bacillus kwashiorkori]|uniref:thioredoxin family protein n=1 Tax=Bacillus kwashiorkori TaxID=1522318 RepID=UPI000784814E|nr:thioredoxin family protein [Bacillus kwashiorkori]